MSPKLELQLKEKYPKILKDMYGDMMKTCMHFGIETGDGWYDLLDSLMHNIQWYCDKPEKNVQLVASQIKTKFGDLRFYFDLHSKYGDEFDYVTNKNDYEVFHALIRYAEDLSAVTCEVCGNKGETFRTGWHGTYCTLHAQESYGNKFLDLHKKIKEGTLNENQ